ncbi:hypothetical protein BaRGS_00020656 [Batillaria attramentaria]|uniref:Uncharacterized protein n=1 Tax=Batillaria attramentaria TaxID=370345 RepID=A0ABD0KMH8_9CAEN
MASLTTEIVAKWHSAVAAFDAGRLVEARELFSKVQDFSAKILFNLSTVDLLLGDYSAAQKRLTECLTRDSYLAVAYFQQGVVECYLGRLNEGKANFMKAAQNIRSTDFIDYRQLGMPVRLTKEQVRHNSDVVQQRLGMRTYSNVPVKFLFYDCFCSVSDKELMVLPLKQCVFRPAKSLVDNLEKRQFLQAAKLVSAVPDIQPVRKSSSTPTSPTLHRKQFLDVVSTTRPGAHTPPPTRPPPRLPPGTNRSVLGQSICRSVNKSDSELDRPERMAVKSQGWTKGGKHGVPTAPGVVPLAIAADAASIPSGDNPDSNGGIKGQRIPPPVRQAPRLPFAGVNDKKPKPPRPPPPPPKKV